MILVFERNIFNLKSYLKVRKTVYQTIGVIAQSLPKPELYTVRFHFKSFPISLHDWEEEGQMRREYGRNKDRWRIGHSC